MTVTVKLVWQNDMVLSVHKTMDGAKKSARSRRRTLTRNNSYKWDKAKVVYVWRGKSPHYPTIYMRIEEKELVR